MIYLIDYENVREHGLKNISYKKHDMIYLFYTENAAKIELDALSEIEAAMKFIKVAAGRQSLDMHLISYLGYLICEQEGKVDFVIVSNDAGYDGVIRFWGTKGYKVSRRLINTAQKASGGRQRSRSRSRSGSASHQAADVVQTEEIVEIVENAPVEDEAVETKAQAPETAAAETAVKEEAPAEPKTVKRSRRGRRRKSETAEQQSAEAAAPEEVMSEPEPVQLPAVPAGKIKMQIIPVKVVENAIPVMPVTRQTEDAAEPAAETQAEPVPKDMPAEEAVAEAAPAEEMQAEAAEAPAEEVPAEAVTEEAAPAEETPAETAAEEAAPAEEMPAEAAAEEADPAEETPAEAAAEEAAPAEETPVEAAAEEEASAEEAPVKEKRTRTRRSSRKTAKKPAVEKPAEEAAEAEKPEKPAESEITQLNNKVMGLYSKAAVDHKIAGQIASLVVKNMNEDNRKAVIYRKIVKQFGQKQGLAYYNVIKKEI